MTDHTALTRVRANLVAMRTNAGLAAEDAGTAAGRVHHTARAAAFDEAIDLVDEVAPRAERGSTVGPIYVDCSNPEVLAEASDRCSVCGHRVLGECEEHGPSAPRPPLPAGIPVIGWTEPTDDEPRSLPIVLGEHVPERWERLIVEAYPRSPGRVHWWQNETPPGQGNAYVVRPVPEPPQPETERVPWGVDLIGRQVEGHEGGPINYLRTSADGHRVFGRLLDGEREPRWEQAADADGMVTVLVEGGRS